MARELVATCAEVEADAVVVDYMLPGGLCGAEATGLPAGALVHTLYGALLRDGELDPMYMAASVATTNGPRGALGLDWVASLGELLRRCERVMVTCPLGWTSSQIRSTPTSATSARRSFVPTPSEQWSPPQTWQTHRRRVAGHDSDGRDRRARARARRPRRRPGHLIATVGDHIDPASVPAPPNATVSSYVTHSLMLPYVDLMVSHAGLGTVLNSLSHGVPLVCVPLGREQPQTPMPSFAWAPASASNPMRVRRSSPPPCVRCSPTAPHEARRARWRHASPSSRLARWLWARSRSC